MNSATDREVKWRGPKTMLAGFALAAVGFGIAQFWGYALGIIPIFFGGALFLVGWILSAIYLGQSYYHSFKRLGMDPRDVYPKAKQPWER